MLKPANLQIKFIKEDKTFFVTLNHLNKKESLSIKHCVEILN